MNEQNQKENRAEKLTDFGFSKVKEADKEKQVKAVFDQVAPKYDLMNDVLSFGMHRLWKQYAIDRAEIQPGMKVLDIAGGTGDMSLLVQKKLSGTGEVWLSDINHEMLKIGDERLKNAGYHPYVLTCDAEYLPFPDGYFDVLSGSTLSGERTDKGEVIAWAFRLLEEKTGQACLPEDMVRIGDREHDIIGAKKNGISSIGVLFGYGSIEELTGAGADAVAPSVDRLAEMLTGSAEA